MEIKILPQQIVANSNGGGLIIEGGVMSSEYSISPQNKLATYQPRQHIFLQKKKKTSCDHHTHNVKQQF